MEGIWLISYIVLWIIVLALIGLVVLLYRQLGIMYLGTAEGVSRDGLATGTQAPDFSLSDSQGHPHRLSDYRGTAVLLLFGSPGCEPCRKLMPQLQDFTREHAGEVEVLWLNDADAAESQRFAMETAANFPLLVDGGRMMDAYRIRVTPFLFMLDESGTIRAKGLVNNRQWLNRYYALLLESKGSLAGEKHGSR